MKTIIKRCIFATLTTSLMLALMILPVFAQEEGTPETFDDKELSGWETSPEVAVTEGTLSIGAGNTAMKIGDYFNFEIQFDMKITGNDGVFFFRYCMGEGEDYALIFFPERIVIEKVSDGSPRELASTEWEGFSGDWTSVELTYSNLQHTLMIDEQATLNAEEDGDPHQGGPVGFFVEGGLNANFDNFLIKPIEGAQTPAGSPEQEAALIETAPTVAPTQTSALESLLAQFTASRGDPLELTTAAVNLVLSTLFAYILSRVYIHWGSALSNRRRFAANFILITVTTTFIILVVRSSIALSLGLVGALSIVRFRAAIKEPEELAYLFFAIGIGIGLGDNQRLITVLSLALIILVIAIARLMRGRAVDFNLHLTIASSNPGKVDLEAVGEILRAHTVQSRLMRTDENKSSLEAAYLVEFRDEAQFLAARKALQGLSDGIEITFLDNKGIG